MHFKVIYQLRGDLRFKSITALDWEHAYREVRFQLPNDATTRAIIMEDSPEAKLDFMEVYMAHNDTDVKVRIKPIKVEVTLGESES